MELAFLFSLDDLPSSETLFALWILNYNLEELTMKKLSSKNTPSTEFVLMKRKIVKR